MNPKKVNESRLYHTSNNNSVPDIILSAADINRNAVRGMAVGMAECNDDLELPAAASGPNSTSHMPTTPRSSQTDQDAVLAEKERIFMGEIHRLIDKYNAQNKQQDDASTSSLPQKRPASSLTETNKRRKESTVMNNAVEIEELLKAEEEKGLRYGKWADRVRELMKHRDDHGHCNVPLKPSSLGRWVGTQRTEFKKFDAGKSSSITPQRLQILNHIGFVWKCWTRMFEQLMEYKEKHGDCLVPNKYEDNPKLGNWVHTQRTEYKNKKRGKQPSMTDERQQKLEEIGFVWKAMR